MTSEQFTPLAERYLDMVYRLALNYGKDPSLADDVTQEVFLRLLRSRTEFQGEEHIKAWLIRVTVNECKRSLGSPWRKTEPLEDEAVSVPFPDREHRELFQLVMGLPPKYRVALYLHYYEGYTAAEIGAMLRIPRATVLTRLRRGREQLKTMLMEAENV